MTVAGMNGAPKSHFRLNKYVTPYSNQQYYMSHISLRTRFALILITLSLLTIVVNFSFNTYSEYQEIREELHKEVEHVHRAFSQDYAEFYLFQTSSIAANLISKVTQFPMILHVDIYAPDETHVFHYAVDQTKTKHAHSHTEEPLNLASILIDKRPLSYGYNVIYEGATLGHVEYLIDTQSALDDINALIKQLAIVIPIFSVISILLAFYFQRLLTRPLTRLINTMDDIEQHQDYSIRMSSKANEHKEFIELQRGFNNMLARVNNASENLKESEARFRNVANKAPMMIWMADTQWHLTFVNHQLNHYLGRSSEELINTNIKEILREESFETFITTVTKHASTEDYKDNIEFELLSDSNEYRWFMGQVVKLTNDNGSCSGYIGSAVDITDRKKAEKEIETLAYYDPLTKLPNRRLLLDRLNRSLLTAQRDKLYTALFYLDLDNFKTLNDSMGHEVGDQLLIHAASRISHTLRAEDSIARLGGDEFVVLSGHMNANEKSAIQNAKIMAEKLQVELSKPYFLGDYEYYSTASIGITIFPHNETTVDDVLKHADTAMYRAKELGRNNFCFYEPSMQEIVVRQLNIDKDLRKALRNNELYLYFQPQVTANGELIGAEALIRWIKEDGTLIPPMDFIPLAEDSGLIINIGYWVLENACEWLKKWEDAGLKGEFTLGVNVSPKQFSQRDFVNQFDSIIKKSGVNPTHLMIEITENVVMDSSSIAIEKMQELKDRTGVQLSLDDFGTGFSSLTYLKQFPLDELKIDRAFVQDLHTDENDALLAETILNVGLKFGLKVIAEGVESSEQVDFLHDKGCQYFQGFLFSKPLPAKEFEKKLSF